MTKGFFEKIPDSLKKFIDASMPREMRLMAAQGLIPVPSKDLVLVLYGLTLGEDKEVSKEAEKSLKSIPEGVAASVLDDESTPSELLGYMARHTDSESQLQRIILNYSTDDDTIAYLAEGLHNQSLLDLIANNQERILRSEGLVEALSKNPAISRSTLDRVISFFSLYLNKENSGHVSPGQYESLAEPLEESLEEIEPTILEDIKESFLDEIDFSEDFVEESEEDIGEKKRESLVSIIKQMNIAQRVKLAILGNRDSRTILVRDPNRVVASGVLKNPRLSDMEVINIAQSKTVDEDILREVAMARKWAKIYQVKVALVNNPKTPSHISLNLIRHLRDREIRALLWNRNLPGVVAASARRIMEEKNKGQTK
ncbi:MAG: hypothetical protein ACREOB_03075 [Thermodesulfobacteriota bacterium]